MKFFTFVQNNSGGDYIYSPEEGIGEYVIIESENASQANKKAEDIGLYFNGVDKGLDCECCGDRWHKVDDYEGKDRPFVYDKEIPIDRNEKIQSFISGYIHYANCVNENLNS